MDHETLKLSDSHFLHFRRVITRMSPTQAAAFAERATAALEKLGVKPNASKSRPAVFEGALTVDVGSMLGWVDKVCKPRFDGDTDAADATHQLQILYATAKSRTA